MPEPQTNTTVGELLRTIGFAASPGILRIFGGVPALGSVIYGLATAWMFVAMVIAIRQALDYKSTVRAVVVCVVTWIIGLVLAAMAGASCSSSPKRSPLDRRRDSTTSQDISAA
jgi:hypothetical protein